MHTKLTKAHLKTRELVLASIAAFFKSPALPDNSVDLGRVNWGHLS